jgi:cysteine synthase
MALRILQQACTEGKIEPGSTISEATSGNTGIAFAAPGRMLGHPVKIFMPDWMSQERVQLIKSYGAEIGQQKRWRVPGQHPDVRRVCGVA